MGFRTGAYATVWGVDTGKGNFTKVRLTVSRKNRETGQFDQDFSGFCTFIGTAHALAAKLKERDRIKLGDVDVSNTYDKESKKEYVNYKVFSFEMANASNAQQQSPPTEQQGENPVDGGDGLPW